MRTVIFCGLLLSMSVVAGCGGAETRQDRAVDRAEDRTASAEVRAASADEDVDDARETEEVLEDHSPEAVEDADEILDETPH